MDLHVRIDPAGPRRAQLEQQLRDAIREGRLRPGTRLPPTRELAGELGVSRGVAVEAYEQLVAEGWLVARRGAGTHVADRPTPQEGSDPFRRVVEGWGSALSPAQREILRKGSDPFGRVVEGSAPLRLDLRTGRPDLSTFPRREWSAAVARALRELPDAALGYDDPRGFAPLRATLAQYLGRVRGVVADPADIVVTGGLSEGLHLLWRALREHGVRRVAIEDPGWRGQRDSIEHAGLEAVPVPVDEDGLRVDALPDDVGAVVVTPAHQFPLGVVLAPERRAALLAFARDRGALLVEDDYDAEYRYDREPVGALQGLAPDRVVFAGSASKTLAPGLRLGWLLAPAWLAPGVARQKRLVNRGVPVLEQAALRDLLDRGEVDRHLRRNRRRYRARRDALAEALRDGWPALRLGGVAAGLHLVAWLPGDVDEAAAHAAAGRTGIAVHALHEHCTVVGEQPGALLLGYAALPEASLARAARELVSAARACAAPRTPATAACSPPARA